MKRYRELCVWSQPPAPASSVRQWLAGPASGARLTPPWAPAGAASWPGWEHQQEVSADGEGARVTDSLRAQSAGGGGPGTEGPLRRLVFAHRQLARDLGRHLRVPAAPPLRIAVTGASGMVGGALCTFLEAGGHQVHRLVRREAAPDSTEIAWDPQGGSIEAAKLEGLDAVVHLAGASIAGARWTDEHKRRILESRVRGTGLLARTLAALGRPPRVLISGSGVHYYRMEEPGPLDESAPAGTHFLADVVKQWEQAAAPAAARGIRVAHPRLATVLDPRSGALARLLPIYRAGLGGKLGHGRQAFPWIALDDAVGGLHHALLDETMKGPFNLVAPQATSNAEFSQALAAALSRPDLFFVPGWALKVAVGEIATLLLAGPVVRPARLEAAGFGFQHPQLGPALCEMLGTFALPEPISDREQRLELQVI